MLGFFKNDDVTRTEPIKRASADKGFEGRVHPTFNVGPSIISLPLTGKVIVALSGAATVEELRPLVAPPVVYPYNPQVHTSGVSWGAIFAGAAAAA